MQCLDTPRVALLPVRDSGGGSVAVCSPSGGELGAGMQFYAGMRVERIGSLVMKLIVLNDYLESGYEILHTVSPCPPR